MPFSRGQIISTVACAALSAAVVYFRILRPRQESSRPITVTQLYVYPIKSCSGMQVDRLPLTPYGVRFDREWGVFRTIREVVVEDSSTSAAESTTPSAVATTTVTKTKFCSQRDFPMMKRIRAVIINGPSTPANNTTTDLSSARGAQLCLRVSVIKDVLTMEEDISVAPLLIPFEPNLDVTTGSPRSKDELEEIEVWGLAGRVQHAGPEAAAWFSERLGEPVFVGRMDPSHRRDATTMPRHGPFVPAGTRINLQDATALHLCTEEGFQFLQKELQDPTMQAHRFRPNIVVRGVKFPQEDQWLTFRFVRKPVTFRDEDEDDARRNRGLAPLPWVSVVQCETLKLTSRCSMPTIDPAGCRTPQYQPTAYLNTHRSLAVRGSAAKPMFGLSVQFTDPKALLVEQQQQEGGGEGDGSSAVELRVGDAVEVITKSTSPW